MKNKILKSMVLAGAMALVLSGCGNDSAQGQDKPAEATTEAATNNDSVSATPITSTWTLVSYTVNGTTTEVNGKPLAEEPAFECSDESNCIVYNAGKGHSGTMVFKDGKYEISFNDTEVGMIGTIDGNQLTLVNPKGTVEFVFRAE